MSKVTTLALLIMASTTMTLTGCNNKTTNVHVNVPPTEKPIPPGEGGEISFDPNEYVMSNLPYLMSAQNDEMVVSWQTESGEESRVLLGTEPGKYTEEFFGEHQRLGYQHHWHTTTLNALEAGKKYYYRVITGLQASKEKSFVAAKGVLKQGHMRFLVIGDHQYAEDDRIDRLVKGAQQILNSKYPEESLNAASLVLNVGDQVDRGTLTDWRDTHFNKMAPLSGSMPFYTVLGNHEYYADPDASLYYAQFKYDHLNYQRIATPDEHSEEYYAFQQGRALFVMTQTETGKTQMTGDERVKQGEWITELVETAENDDNIDWIFAVGHHPYRSELGKGDEEAMVDRIITDELQKSSKFAMWVGAHTHNYSRGTFPEKPGYHIVAGGASFDEYWSERATPELDGNGNVDNQYYNRLVANSVVNDYDQVSHSTSIHNFQLVDIDLDNDTVTIETYSTGNQVNQLSKPVLSDSFSLSKQSYAPSAPIVNLDSTSVDIESGVVMASLTGLDQEAEESLFSTEFVFARPNPYTSQCSRDTAELIVKRDIVNYFGAKSDSDLVGVDQVAYHNLNIREIKIGNQTDAAESYKTGTYALSNTVDGASYCVKARYRTKEQVWSEYSQPATLSVSGSSVQPQLFTETINIPLNGQGEPASSSRVTLNTESEGNPSFVTDDVRGQVLEVGQANPSSSTTRSGFNYTPTDSSLNEPSKWLAKNAISMSIWLKPSYRSNWGCYFGNGQEDTQGFCIGMRQNKLWSLGIAAKEAPVKDSPAGFSYLRVTKEEAQADIWSHIVATYDNRHAKFYLNGELVHTEEKGADLIWNPTNYLSLGTGWTKNEGDHERFFNGRMSDAKIWDRALSPEEISIIYTKELK